MAKFPEKIKAQVLRRKGRSIKEIARKLKVSKSSASLWCRDIKLNAEQIKRLHEQSVKGGYIGRLKGARLQHRRRIERIKRYKKLGSARLEGFSNKDLLVAGVALYWGEGLKTYSKAGISNSDPKIIEFMLNWFRRVWKVEDQRFRLHILINQIHKKRVDKVERYWSRITHLPRSQFNKTTLIKAKSKKVYENFSSHYGTLMVRVNKPHLLHHQIIGLIEKMGKLGIELGKGYYK